MPLTITRCKPGLNTIEQQSEKKQQQFSFNC